MSKVRAVISDVDGTLIDTLEVIRRGQYEAATMHYEEIGMHGKDLPTYDAYHEAFLKVVGGHVRETLESTSSVLYKDRPDIFELLDFDRMAEILQSVQDKLAEDNVKPYKGLQTLLNYIGSHELAFGIFTSGRPRHVMRNFGVALPELDMRDLYLDDRKNDQEKLDTFANTLKKTFGLRTVAVITGDDVSAHKPDPEPVYAILDRLGVQPESAVAFGDHMVDMKSAAGAGVTRRIGVTHGFDDEQVLRQAGATDVVDSLDDFREYLQNQR